MKKIVSVVLVLMTVLLMLTACKSSGTDSTSSKQITLTMTHFYTKEEMKSSDESTLFHKMIDQFQKDNPNIKLDITEMTQDNYATKIQAQATANDAPDVFLLKGSWTTTFVDNKIVAPLDSFIDSSGAKDKYRNGIFKAATRSNKIYGSPVQFAVTSLIFYNQDMWKSIGYDTFPNNWNDILAAIPKFKAKSITPFALGNKDKWPYESCILSSMGDRFTGTDWTNNIIDKNGKSKFTDPDFVKSLDFSQKMAKAGIFNPDFNAIQNNQADTYYCQGKAASTFEGYWDVAYIQTNATKEILKATKIAVLPPVDGGKGDANSTSGGCGWYLSANGNLNGEKLAAAGKLIMALTGEKYSKDLATQYGQIGAVNVGDVDTSKFPQLTQDYVKLMNSVKMTPIYDIQMEGSVIDTMNTGLQELLNGTTTPAALATKIQAEQDKLAK